ncbi:hypothetical protein DF053_07325 [Burkholderia cepacia]|nr:hypothetical protein DF053_07325 [Burkholderia cepacia]
MHNHCAAHAAAGRKSACADADLPRAHRLTGSPAHRHGVLELASIKMQPYSVLARLRIRHDDFGIYQGYRRYADIVAGRAPNAQDARIFAV